MRWLLVALASVASCPVIAMAQPLKQVEVTNLPAVQDVNIVGGGTAPARFQIVGFTTATYTGDLGGLFGATRKCQLEFPESRMCNPLEVQETTSIPAGLAGFAWVNGNPNAGCSRWTDDTGEFANGGPVVSGETGLSSIGPQFPSCGASRPIACCAAVP